MQKIVLASSSPQRAELLARFRNFHFEVVPPDIDESNNDLLPPEDLVTKLSIEKADYVAARFPSDTIVIAADTVISMNGLIYSKPASIEQAAHTITELSGQWHSVYTGLTVSCGGIKCTEVEVTGVLLRKLTQQQILSYVNTGESMNKSGAYGIEGYGSLLCERIDGDYYNIVGLPLYRLSIILERFGIDMFSF